MKISSEFINKYNKPGPRYTSYPPATFFHENFVIQEVKNKILLSNSQQPENISIYIHIPFCPKQCSFCGCTTVIGKGKSVILQYVEALISEIKQVSEYIDKSRKVSQIHWGGGTPNSIPLEYIGQIMTCIKEIFSFTDNAEVAIECSPAYLKLTDIPVYAAMGFNRMSLGIQDFDDKVLSLVNREKSKYPVDKIVATLRENNFKGINLDLIYGLPGQTPESFIESVKKAVEINPDRIVTFSYAHVPWVKEFQKRLEEVGLPSPDQKMLMLTGSLELLTNSGYVQIGMDHYAKEDDDISIALKNKKLHRNFQGYCTLETTGQVYGFGASSITQLQGAYIQNTKNLSEYVDSVNRSGFAVEKVYFLSQADEIRRKVINEVMCNNYLDLDEITKLFAISLEELKSVLGFEISKFDEFVEDNLLKITGNVFEISEKGRLIVRNIAMKFDPTLKEGAQVYSKTV